jgi:hypothetical protein
MGQEQQRLHKPGELLVMSQNYQQEQLQQIEQIINNNNSTSIGDCPYTKISALDKSFWDLWLQKVFRNFASVKYQFMVFFFWLVVYGMFFEKNKDGISFISSTEGLTFLGGGFITLAVSRIVLRTSLFEPKGQDNIDTDQ